MDRFQHSIRAFQQSKMYLAGGVSSMMRSAVKPVPLFFRSASRDIVTDVDGNEYFDYTLGWGPLILGHSHPTVLRAVRAQLAQFQHLGAQHELESEVARKVCEMIPSGELVAFSNTGTEAVQLALRLARGYTRRQKFIKFEGHYHGWFDNTLASYHPTGAALQAALPVAGSEGQSRSSLNDVIVLPWNDFDALESVVEQCGDEIAAIITEPILCNSSCLMPEAGYLRKMRDLARRFGIILIFDEVITGFRVAAGGAQSLLGVIPDLTVLGKALGAGFPLSAVAGRNDIMELIPQRRVVHAGTFNGNPISLAAAKACLDVLSAGGGRALKKLDKLGQQLISGIAACAAEAGIPCLVNGIGPVFHVSFTSRTSMRNYRDTLDCDIQLRDQFIQKMLEHGIYLIPDGRWYLSAAHTRRHVDETLAAVRKVFAKLPALVSKQG